MRYEKYIMGIVLLLVFFGLLNTPLNLCVNAAWRLLLNPDRLCGTAVRHCLMAHLNLSKERYPLFYGNTYL